MLFITFNLKLCTFKVLKRVLLNQGICLVSVSINKLNNNKNEKTRNALCMDAMSMLIYL